MPGVQSNYEDNRAYNAGEGQHDSPDMVRRAGGDLGMDPRRHAAKILIERKVFDHDMSGYNHNATPNQPANGAHENEIRYAHMQDRRVANMGSIQPNGKFEY